MKRADKLLGCSEILLNQTRTAMLANIVHRPDGISLAANDKNGFMGAIHLHKGIGLRDVVQVSNEEPHLGPDALPFLLHDIA